MEREENQLGSYCPTMNACRKYEAQSKNVAVVELYFVLYIMVFVVIRCHL